MTPKTRTPPASPGDSAERIEDIDVSNEMQDSFLEYAYSVIYARALPDARDGLKPVQRRILYQMAEMGLRPDRGHVKSARVTGEVMGKLHPHGDGAIYDALVRMAQDFTLRVPLVDGHGNFGSLDDGPAAARYTEARLAAAALAMTADLDEDVVDFVPNYDNRLVQPDVLPAAFPNLLVNGASGIAVGMATNMAPHNLVEVVAAARHLLDRPDATVEELMDFIPGPDLPTGGMIVGLDGIRDAYATGRGSFKTRAKVSVEQVTARKTGLVVTELPYLIGPEKVIEKIKDGVTSKKLSGISDVVDLTDRTHGLRLVIELKSGFSAPAVLEQLYRYTPLEDGFSINNVALVDGRPQTLGLRELLRVYLDHRIAVVTRRSRYRLARRQDRLHLVEGLLRAILDIDEVIQVVRSSDDTAQARARLIEIFDLSERQADYILELQLRRLTRFSRIELEDERDRLRLEIAELEVLLADSARIRTLVSDELEEVSERFGTPRRTLLTQATPQAVRSLTKRGEIAVEIADTPCEVVLSTTGRVVRVDLPDGASTGSPRRRSRHDAVLSRVTATTRGTLGAITSTGRMIRFTPVDLPSVPPNSVQLGAGAKIGDHLGITDRSERVLGLVAVDQEEPVALGTRRGVVKRFVPAAMAERPSIEVIALKPGDQLIGSATAADSAEVVFLTSDARLLRFTASSVRPQGAAAGGMAGIAVGKGAVAIAFGAVASVEDAVVVTVSSSSATLPGADEGRAKVTALAEFPSKGRGTGGVRAHTLLKGEDGLYLAWVGPAPAVAVASDGGLRTLPEIGARRDASGTPLEAAVGSIGSAL